MIVRKYLLGMKHGLAKWMESDEGACTVLLLLCSNFNLKVFETTANFYTTFNLIELPISVLKFYIFKFWKSQFSFVLTQSLMSHFRDFETFVSFTRQRSRHFQSWSSHARDCARCILIKASVVRAWCDQIEKKNSSANRAIDLQRTPSQCKMQQQACLLRQCAMLSFHSITRGRVTMELLEGRGMEFHVIPWN